MDDEYDYDHEAPLSPASSDDDSCSSDEEGSLTSTCSSSDDKDEDDDFLEDMPEAKTPPPQQMQAPMGEPAIYEAEEPRVAPYHHQPEYMQPYHHHHSMAVPEPVHAMPVPVQPCAPKFQLQQYVWDMLRYGQPTPPMPQLHHPVTFQHQVPMFAHMQGCY